MCPGISWRAYKRSDYGMTKIKFYHQGLKAYFGDEVYDRDAIGKHVQEFFDYCDRHSIFWDAESVYAMCPMCYRELDPKTGVMEK